jgi:hypothetical protein
MDTGSRATNVHVEIEGCSICVICNFYCRYEEVGVGNMKGVQRAQISVVGLRRADTDYVIVIASSTRSFRGSTSLPSFARHSISRNVSNALVMQLKQSRS